MRSQLHNLCALCSSPGVPGPSKGDRISPTALQEVLFSCQPAELRRKQVWESFGHLKMQEGIGGEMAGECQERGWIPTAPAGMLESLLASLWPVTLQHHGRAFHVCTWLLWSSEVTLSVLPQPSNVHGRKTKANLFLTSLSSAPLMSLLLNQREAFSRKMLINSFSLGEEAFSHL